MTPPPRITTKHTVKTSPEVKKLLFKHGIKDQNMDWIKGIIAPPLRSQTDGSQHQH